MGVSKMKTRLLIILLIITLGISQIQESFSDDSIPPCNIGVFVSDNIQCYIEDSPPCKEPSLEKNGLCVVEKNDICEKGNILTDGVCIPNTGNFRVDDPTFTKQYLLTGKPMLNPNSTDFRDLQTGEAISNPEVAIILESLGAILIVFFIVIYAVKKRMKKSIEEKKENEK